ncbi:hypothetical protein [Nocardia sp. NPDC050175]|uniref:hypothetical protein n=1 Tax=Nocardia sp. NPDC050175 TaxID=3364317 RepID=UPI0037AD03DE
MTESQGLIESVAKWLRSQGYPLEMRTAREFQSRDIWAVLGYYYVDVETGQQRETDVLVRAHRDGEDSRGVSVALTIECKSARDKPWILFTGETNRQSTRAIRRSLRFVAPDSALHLLSEGLDPEDDVPLLDGYEPFGYALVRAHGGGNEDVAFGAMMSAVKAAAGARREIESFGFVFPTVVLPIVLIDAPLLQCRLDEDGEPQLSMIERGTVSWNYRIKTSTIPMGTDITVVTSGAVPGLADDLITTTESLLAAASRGSRE